MTSVTPLRVAGPGLPFALAAGLSGAVCNQHVAAVLTLIALFVFGAFKGRFTGSSVLRRAVQTILVGAAVSSAALLIAQLVSGSGRA